MSLTLFFFFFHIPLVPGSIHLAGECKRITRCALSFSYESIAPTASSDRICEAVSACGGSQYITTPATLVSDVVCKNCSVCTQTHFQIAACTANADTRCRGCSGCLQGQYLLVPCGSKDTFCGDCSAGCLIADSYYDGICDPSLPLNCTRYTKCGVDEFESVAGSKTSDRRCSPVKNCGLGEQESIPPTTVTDRVCAPCPVGTGGQGCATCPPGRYTPVGTTDCMDPQYLCAPGSVDDDSSAATTCLLCNGETDYQDVAGGVGECKFSFFFCLVSFFYISFFFPFFRPLPLLCPPCSHPHTMPSQYHRRLQACDHV
jgi:hypothetical protein